jgi:rhodanese-related sulfurtransferase
MKQIAVQDLTAHCAAQPTLLLDVREPWEVEIASIQIPGATTLAIPMNEVPGRFQALDGAPSVVCICHHGMRSAQVVAFLERQGIDAVYNLAGGIAAWSQSVDPRVPTY